MARNRNSAFQKDRTFNIINPIAQATRDGVFKLSTNSIEKYKANLYTLIFTGIGERVMEPEFGTLLKYLLFEPLTTDTNNKIQKDIIEKVAFWIPEINIIAVVIDDDVEDLVNNRVAIRIDFNLKRDSTVQDFIEIEMGV